MALENFKVLRMKNWTSEITSSQSCETYILYTQQWPEGTQKPFRDHCFTTNLCCSSRWPFVVNMASTAGKRQIFRLSDKVHDGYPTQVRVLIGATATLS